MTSLSSQALAGLFEEAQDLHQAGHLPQALERYKRILAVDPANAPTLHMAGVLAFQNGQNDVAIDLITRARAAGLASATLHSNLGLALRAAGRLDEAVASFRRSLSLNPDTAQTHNNLGMVLLQQGRIGDAVDTFSRAVALDPGLAAAHANLGDALWAQGKLREAEACHLKALALDATDPDVLKSLAMLALARGDADNAMRRACQALAVDDSSRSHRVFAEIARSVRWHEDDPQLRHYLLRAVTEGWSRPGTFSGTGFCLIQARLAAGGRLEDDALLAALLKTAPVSDAVLERHLTRARRAALLDRNAPDEFVAALAAQCFLNEYVWQAQSDEMAEVGRLRENPQGLSEAQWLALACYIPLGAEPGAAQLEAKSAALATVLRQQRDEPARERLLAKAIPELAPVKDKDVEAVRARYEEAPYPRWTTLPAPVFPANLRAYLAGRFPGAALTPGQLPDQPSLLVAGCGTGQYLLEMARDFSLGAVTGVDLSRASLAYAARKAEEAGIGNIRFGVADILALGGIGEFFDVIECRGVLHHLPDPLAGLQALADCLHSGGVMLVAFHSSRARRPIAALRDWARQQDVASTEEGVRALRARLMAERPEGRFGGVLGLLPFYTTSACRELFFERNEKTHTLEQVGKFLADSGLRLIGVDAAEPVRAAYRARFPDDPETTNLGNWALFEEDHPETFAGMYNLWVQKAALVAA